MFCCCICSIFVLCIWSSFCSLITRWTNCLFMSDARLVKSMSTDPPEFDLSEAELEISLGPSKVLFSYWYLNFFSYRFHRYCFQEFLLKGQKATHFFELWWLYLDLTTSLILIELVSGKVLYEMMDVENALNNCWDVFGSGIFA